MKNTVTLNHSGVSPDIHASLVAHVAALGYFVVARSDHPDEGSSEAPLLEIPALTRFDVPADSTVDSAGQGLPMSDYCRQNLTEANFGTELPKGLVAGGFLHMGRAFESSDAVRAIEELALRAGRRFRVGTPTEALLFKKQHAELCPKYFAAFGKVWNGRVLHWGDDCAEFDLHGWDGEWDENFRVFFVEDL